MSYALDVTLTTRAREAVEYALMEAGANGTELTGDENGEVHVSGYFEKAPGIERVRERLFEALKIYELESADVRAIAFREVRDEDWLAEWKKGWRPVNVGTRFVVAPTWAEVAAEQRQFVIRIDPGMAFGTGTHETTKLCLEAIEKCFRGGSFYDIGTGTGILAIAAALLYPTSRIVACDIDSLAVEIARDNAKSNGVYAAIDFRVGSVDEVQFRADVVCANLTADVIIQLLPWLAKSSTSLVILSGILSSQEDTVVSQAAAAGLTINEITRDGEWIAVVCEVAIRV